MLKTRLPNGSVPLSKNSRCRYLGLGNESSWQARCRHFIPATIYSDSTTHRSERDLSTLRSLLGTIYLRSQVISNVSDDVVPRDCSPISLFDTNQTWCIRPRHLSPTPGRDPCLPRLSHAQTASTQNFPLARMIAAPTSSTGLHR